MIGKKAGQLLQPYEHAIDNGIPAAGYPGLIHFRRQVVMVIDKTFAEQLVQHSDKDKGIRRIMRMDSIKAFS